MMTKQGVKTFLLVVLSLVVLRQAIAIGSNEIDQLRTQVRLIEVNEIDPTALFYTESKLALNAEKEVARRIQEGFSGGR